MASRLVLAFRAAWDVVRSLHQPPAAPPPTHTALPRFLARTLRRLADILAPAPRPEPIPYETRLRAALAETPANDEQLRDALAAEARHRAAFDRAVHALGPEVSLGPRSVPPALPTALDDGARQELAISVARASTDGVDLRAALGRTPAQVDQLVEELETLQEGGA